MTKAATQRTCSGCGADLTGTHGKRKWCSERCRRNTMYAGTCEGCGAPTNGSNGRSKAPTHCRDCAPEANRIWTEETILAAMHEWYRLFGRPPSMLDWNLALAAYKKLPNLSARRERFGRGRFPTANSVLNRFGTWRAALAAAGFEVRKGGHSAWWPETKGAA